MMETAGPGLEVRRPASCPLDLRRRPLSALSLPICDSVWSSAREHGPVSPAAVDLGPSVHATLWDLGQVALRVQVSVPYL